MQVGDTVPVDLQTLANETLRASVGNHIEQHLAGIPDKSVRPARDHAGADEANDGVDPRPSEPKRDNEASDGHDRGERIGKDVQIGCTKIVVPMVVTLRMILTFIVMVRMLFAEQPAQMRLTASPTTAMEIAWG
jgi:hypothetical protein